MGFKEGAQQHKQCRGQQVVVQHISAVHGQGDALGGRKGEIAQQAGGISDHTAQIEKPAGLSGKRKRAQQIAQQNITEVPLQQGIKQIEVHRKNLVEQGADGGGEHNDSQQHE